MGKAVRPRSMTLEILARVLVPSEMHEAWKCSFDINAALPLCHLVSGWVGEALELRGELVVRGERFSRRVGPHVQ